MKEKQTVFVKIVGLAGTGKTTIACKLGRALKEVGIETEIWELDNSYQDDITNEAIDRNLHALSEKIHVIIQTEQMKRHIV